MLSMYVKNNGLNRRLNAYLIEDITEDWMLRE